jgi:pyrroloquinoline-quinone synthase
MISSGQYSRSLYKLTFGAIIMSTWIEQLDKLIQAKHMLLHPFYQAWTKGKLSKATLQEYAKDYYHHIKGFPTYLSSLHSRSEDLQIRKALLHNLMDEEAGEPNHLELWRNFTYTLGVTEEELEHHEPKEAVQALVQHFKENCKGHSSIAPGIAALYCYESQIPTICKTKIEGLKTWYGFSDPEGYRYFSEHETADIEHSREERQLLLDLVQPHEEELVLRVVDRTLQALEDFLSSFEHCAACA